MYNEEFTIENDVLISCFGCDTHVSIPHGIKTIKANAFLNCPIESLDIPDSVIKIENDAFKNCIELRAVIIGNKIRSLPVDVFIDCPLEIVKMGDSLTEICDSLIHKEYLTEIIIGKNVNKIKSGMFSGCTKLKEVYIGPNVTHIGDRAFANCISLETISADRGYSITSIGNQAFCYCDSLVSISVPPGVESIGKEAFAYCKKLNKLSLPETVVEIANNAFLGIDCVFCTCYQNMIGAPWGAKSINKSDDDDVLFDGLYYSDTSKSKIVFCDHYGYDETLFIPNSVTEIGEFAFNGCVRITEIFIPDSVVAIASTAFESSNIEYFHVDEQNKYYSSQNGIIYNKELNRILFVPSKLNGSVSIPEGVTEISSCAFYKRNITEIIIPGSVKRIMEFAFFNCCELKKVTLFEGVEIISFAAFGICKKLSEIQLPGSIKRIESCAFIFCDELKSVIIPEGIESVGDHAFKDVAVVYYFGNSINEIGLENCGAQSINRNALNNAFILNDKDATEIISCSSQIEGNIVIPEGITSIGDYAFKGTDITGVTLPSSLRKIGKYAFSCCNSVSSITIPDNVIYIGEGAFFKCENLKNIIVPEGITSIADYAFEFTNITDITLPSSLKKIGKYAFSRCNYIPSITIPDNVIFIDEGAFSECRNLKTVNIGIGLSVVKSKTFYSCRKLKTINFSSGLYTIEKYAFSRCSSVSNITIPESVKTIEERAFDGCRSLTDVCILSDKINIVESTFVSCGRLKKIWKSKHLCAVCGGVCRGNETRTCKRCGYRNQKSQ